MSDSVIETPVVAIAGKAGAGKGVAGDGLARLYRVKQVAFADPMKHFILKCHRITEKELWGPSEERGQRLRTLLQLLGTEAMQSYDKSVWVTALLRRLMDWEDGQGDPDINPYYKPIAPYETDFVVVTDLRFIHELEGLRKFTNSIILKITRPWYSQESSNAEHVSEIELDSIPDEAYDAVIKNSGTAAELEEQVNYFVSTRLEQLRSAC